MTDDATLSALDVRGRSAAAGVHAATAHHPVPAFDPDVVRIPIDGAGPSAPRRPRRAAGALAVAAALLVVALAVAALVVGRGGGGEGARADDAGPAGDVTSTTDAAPTTPPTGAAGTAVLAFRPVLVDEEGTGASPSCVPGVEVDGGEVLPYRPDLAAPPRACITVGPIGFDGTDLSQVVAQVGGASGDEWVISVRVAPDARARANVLANGCADGGATCPTRRMAVVVDDEVLSAPTVEGRDLADDEFLLVAGGPDGLSEAEARALVARIQGR